MHFLSLLGSIVMALHDTLHPLEKIICEMGCSISIVEQLTAKVCSKVGIPDLLRNQCVFYINHRGGAEFTQQGDRLAVVTVDGYRVDIAELPNKGAGDVWLIRFVGCPEYEINFSETGRIIRVAEKPSLIFHCDAGDRKFWLSSATGEIHGFEDQPAIVDPDGAKRWYLNNRPGRIGNRHNVELPDGTCQFRNANNELHRMVGPAVFNEKTRTAELWQNGKRGGAEYTPNRLVYYAPTLNENGNHAVYRAVEEYQWIGENGLPYRPNDLPAIIRFGRMGYDGGVGPTEYHWYNKKGVLHRDPKNDDDETVLPAIMRTEFTPDKPMMEWWIDGELVATQNAVLSIRALAAAGGDLVKPAAGGDLVKPAAGGDLVKPAAGGDLVKPAAGGDLVKPAAGGGLASGDRVNTVAADDESDLMAIEEGDSPLG
jgi:hypothetical protein